MGNGAIAETVGDMGHGVFPEGLSAPTGHLCVCVGAFFAGGCICNG